MDLQLALIGVIIAIVLAVLLYIIHFFGMKEKTYEEAIAEQRRRTDDSWFQTKSEKAPKISRYKKKKEENKHDAKRKQEKAAKEKGKNSPKKVNPPSQTIPQNTSPPVHSAENHSARTVLKVQSDTSGEGIKEKKQKLMKNTQVKSIAITQENKVIPDVSRKRPHSQIAENNSKEEINLKHIRDKKESHKIENDLKHARDKKESHRNESDLKHTSDKKETFKNENDMKRARDKKEPNKNDLKKTHDKKELNENDLKNLRDKKEPHKNEINLKQAPVREKKEQQKNETDLKQVRDKKEKAKEVDLKHNRDKKELYKPLKQEEIKREASPRKEESKTEPGKKKQEKVVKDERKVDSKKQIVEESVKPSRLDHPVAVAIPIKKPKKIKIENSALQDADDALLHYGRWQDLLKSASLSDAEIQTLIEVLLNKQHGVEWTQKSQKIDPVATLKKQLQENETLLAEHKQLSQTASIKLKELRQELGQEKSRFQQLERSTKEQANQQNQENKALQLRMQHSHEQHLTETSALQTKLQQVTKEESNKLQKQIEENKQLRESISKLENENKVASSHEINKLQQELKTIKSEKDEFENQLIKTHSNEKQLQNKISECEERMEKMRKSQKEEEMTRNKRINQLADDLKKAETQKITLSEDLKKIEATKKNIEKDNTSLKTKLTQLEDASNEEVEKLKESEKAKLELDNKIQSLKSQLNEMNNQQTSKDRVIQESEKARLDMDNKVQSLKSQLNERNNEQVAKDREIQELREENENLAAQVSASQRAAAEGQEDVGNENEDQSTVTPNGDIHSDEMIDKVKGLLSEQQNIVTEKSKVIEELHEELKNHKTEVTRLAEEIEQLKKKNNDLREKNWKAMDAVTAAEKTAEEKLNVMLKSSQEKEEKYLLEQQTSTKKLLQRIFPDVHINSSTNHLDWLGKFEKEAVETIVRYSSQTVSQDVLTQLSEAESNQSKLQTQVHHYKKVLEDTEGILNKLQNSVEAEEKKWQEKLSILTTELDQVKAEKKALEESLVHIRAAEETTSEVCGLEFAYNCVEKSLPSIVDEMEVKLIELQHKLEGEELERRALQEKHNHAIERAAVLEENLSTFQKEIDNLKQQNASTEATQKELAELKNHLEKEKKTNKDLTSQVVKLNSLVKIGQDSLKLEQDVVKKLQEQLQDKTMEDVPVQNEMSSSSPELDELNLTSEDQVLLTDSSDSSKPKKLERRRQGFFCI